MSIIGQTKLVTQLKKHVEENTLPQFIMLVGEKGQGRKTLTFFLKSLLGTSSTLYVPNDLKVDAVREMIEDAQTLFEKRIYLLADSDDMTVQAQNALLKFVEEPPRNAIIVMTVQHEDNVLQTIKSRASVMMLEQYKREDLLQVTEDELLLQLCDNIGQVKKFFEYDMKQLLKLAETVADNIHAINTANAFNILKHIDIEDADLFIRVLLYVYKQKMHKPTRSGKTMLMHQLKTIYKYKAQLKSKSINKQNALEMMFVEMKEVPNAK